ncbi:MAG: MBL fold metallo-hydrolase [Saprospiraceae bacterium]|nr:MBL fold metallo-hydrolase [Pyrinomonadaceae bacterium]
MKFKQFYLGCLSHASYYIGSESEGAVIDPQRDVQQYIDEAAANGQHIKYVIETHSHADFVSGHIELAEKTGAAIIYGRRANTEFPTLKVKNGDELSLGNIVLQFLETPGHTPESICVIAQNTENGEALKLFTGDTLFIGDVGRPDLIGSAGFTAEDMGSMLYDSLHSKIMPLPDDTEVYPAHGAGSLCGKSLSNETWSTLGNQKQFNYALKPMSKSEFVELVTDGQTEVPSYFPKSAAKNLQGALSLDDLPKPSLLSSEQIESFDGIVLDIRTSDEFGRGHILNAINIGLGGKFASWAGTFIPIGTPLALAANTDEEIDEGFMRLARIGFESVERFILMKNFKGEISTIEQISVEAVNEITSATGNTQFLDVRQPGEYAAAHARQTYNLPLNILANNLDKLDPDLSIYVICQTGYRSSLAASILKNAGIKNVFNVAGGTSAWIDAGLETEASTVACANP